MAGQMVHVEIPAGDTAKAREFWGSLFGWEWQTFEGGPTEYHMTRFSETTGGAIYAPDPRGSAGPASTSTSTTSTRATHALMSSAERRERRCLPRAWAGSRSARTRRATSSASGRPIPRRPRRDGSDLPSPRRRPRPSDGSAPDRRNRDTPPVAPSSDESRKEHEDCCSQLTIRSWKSSGRCS